MKESERLRAARKLIEKPENWMQGGYADNPHNGLANACRFCSIGAVLRVRGEEVTALDFNSTSRYLQRVLDNMNEGSCVADFNDNHSHSHVMELFDAAITIAESEES
jgi:hypothetical protein